MRIVRNKKTRTLLLVQTDQLQVNDKYDVLVTLTTDLLRNRVAVRPLGTLGTCGGYPFQWVIGWGSTREKAGLQFIEKNSKSLDMLIVNQKDSLKVRE